MTVTMERYATSVDTDTELDFDGSDLPELDLEVGGAMDCLELGEHRDAYVVEEDLYTIKYECEACGDSYSEDK